jgi:hypothetical protein
MSTEFSERPPGKNRKRFYSKALRLIYVPFWETVTMTVGAMRLRAWASTSTVEAISFVLQAPEHVGGSPGGRQGL